MESTTGQSQSNAAKTLWGSWGLRFTIAIIGSIVTFGWSGRWLHGYVFPPLHTRSEYWLEFVVPFLLRTLVPIFFLFWMMKLLIELRFSGFIEEDDQGTAPRLIYKRLAIWGVAGLAAIAFPQMVLSTIRNLGVSSAPAIMRITGWI